MKRSISKVDLIRVKELNLLSYFSNYDPDELIKNGRTDFVTRTYSSLHLSNGLWYHWRTGFGGRTALDYLIKIEGYDFLDAALYLLNLINNQAPVMVKQHTRDSVRFKLPDHAFSNSIAIDYLVKVRKIDKKIVKELVDAGYIYESVYDHAVVFVGYDEFGKARHAMKRSTSSNDKKDVFGSSKEYGFSLSNPSSNVLHVFESTIDLLSYLTLMKMDNEDYRDGNYISLNGVGGSNLALDSYLMKHGYIKHLVLHLDNDKAGDMATEKIKEDYKDKYYVFDRRFKSAKDINEFLINTKN